LTPTLQRKKPVQRVFTGLAGRFAPEPDTTPSPVASTPPPVAPVHQNTEEILVQIELSRQEKEAKRSRENRRRKQEQLAAIKQALRTPFAEVKLIAKAKTSEEKLDSMSRGMALTGAPSGKGNWIYTGDIEQIGAAASRAAALGAETEDPETGEAFWPDTDRRPVKPEGTGERGNGTRSVDEQKVSAKPVRNPLLDAGVPQSRSRFKVRLPSDDKENVSYFSFKDALKQLIARTFVADETEPEEEGVAAICRLCQRRFLEERPLGLETVCITHVKETHGDEDEPNHDPRFGNIITRYIR
jgi:hypothetical protein